MHDITLLATDLNSREHIDLASIVRELCIDQVGVTSVAIELNDQAQGACTVHADRTALRRCIENLFSNATRFAKSRVIVSVEPKIDDHEVELTVEDDGNGLPDANAYRTAFKPNVRHHMNSGQSGSGLGLSIVKEIVERCGGNVRGKNSEYGGAKFIVRLPSTTNPRTIN
jgi:signal transduction histidine kinase